MMTGDAIAADARPDITLRQAVLRVLATTDLHANLIAWDYYSHRPADGRGLSRVARLIDVARSQIDATILLDNGDFLAGSGLGDYVARHAQTGSPHPMVLAMNAIGYDAVNLGNHEFSHGIAFLQAALSGAKFPVICTNFDFHSQMKVQPSAMIKREVVDQTGQAHTLVIGVMGLLPVQTLVWENASLEGMVTAQPMEQAARLMVKSLRAQGADLVIALAHTGLAKHGADLGEENHADKIANICDIDAVIAGHSHMAFPETTPDSDGKAIVLPGFFGSHLGVLDLTLQHDGVRWRVARHERSLRAVASRDNDTGSLTPLVDDCPEIRAMSEPMHSALIAQAQQVIGQLPRRLHTYFSTVSPTSAMDLIAQAQADYVVQLLPQTKAAGLPILSAVAPFKAGGRGGPENYSDLPMGPFRYHYAADLYLHPNTFVAFQLSAAEVALWLERSVSQYHHILHGAQDEELVNADFPSFNYDIIYGLTYEIDLSQPAMFDSHGVLVNPATRRIRNLRYQGQPLPEDQVFVLASNSYRRAGGAGFAGADADHVLCETNDLVQDILRNYVAKGAPAPQARQDHWRFSPQPGTTVVFTSSPRAGALLGELAHLNPQSMGQADFGFQRFRFHL